jgi:hypothetical protein
LIKNDDFYKFADFPLTPSPSPTLGERGARISYLPSPLKEEKVRG